MKITDLINNDLNKIMSYENLTSKILVLNKYPQVEAATCGGEVPIFEVFDLTEIDNIYVRFKPYLDNPDVSSESQMIPVIGGIGNTYICLGFGQENRGFVYYFDCDFGTFLLDENVDSFLSKLDNN